MVPLTFVVNMSATNRRFLFRGKNSVRVLTYDEAIAAGVLAHLSRIVLKREETKNAAKVLVWMQYFARERVKRLGKGCAKRHHFTGDETKVLWGVYNETNGYPSKEVREHLVQQLGLSAKEIFNWFKNRRAEMKMNGDARGTF